MDRAEERRRWETSQELYRAAETALTAQHYRAQPIPSQQAQQGLNAVEEVIQAVRQHKRLEENL
jgi:hypothetical protein